ncbi:MAG: type II toxin-antitoxin system VapC family toxin [Calditrichaeota bacterium]|nr:type II toxin-antitoxin system VapC family toxin [Calditrichota bacterium]
MIGFDANVLLRLIVRDDPSQTARVVALLDHIEVNEDTVFLSDMVLCEFVWTLRTAYRKPRQEIVSALNLIADVIEIKFESAERFYSAIRSYAHGQGDFADYLIREKSLANGCSAVATFDKALLNEPGFIEP